jgi:DNA-directed RNA polymerase alpha subunit
MTTATVIEPISDAQLLEIELTDKEKLALAMRADGKTYEQIASDLFDDELTRQGAYELVKQAERKQWRLNAKKRYDGKLASCPVEELPIPGRTRNALEDAGYLRVGQLAGMSRETLSTIPGVGRRHGSFLLYALLQSWGLTNGKRKRHAKN